MRVPEAVEFYKLAILELTPQTQRWYAFHLDPFAQWCEDQGLHLEQVKPAQTRKYLEYLRTTPSEKTGTIRVSYTIHGYARAIRAFMRWCSQEEDLDNLVTMRASRVDMPKVEKRVLGIFDPEEIRALLKACSKEMYPEMQKRSYAAIWLLYDTGIRASEFCGLTLDDVHITSRDAYIKVLGKGRKEREIGLGRKSREALYKYIHRFRKAGKDEYHVFLSRTHTPMTIGSLDHMLYRLAGWAGVEDCHAHKFRHTFAVNYLEAGGELFDLARLMGHSTTMVTQLYLEAYTSTQARRKGISVGDLLK